MKNIELEKYNIKKEKMPKHIAIVMDGNGRWANIRGMKRIEGHKKGIETIRDIVESCGYIGIKYLTLYTFSEENWARPAKEVKQLMELLYEHLESEINELMENNVKVKFIGRLYKVPKKVRKRIEIMEEKTKNNKGLNLILALSYGGRAEIVDAVNKILKEKIKKVNINNFKKYLYTNNIPDPDLLIRTSGEYRLSNFLLYQIAYTEIYITDVLWPDFNTEELLKAIYEYQQRERRFGKI